MYAAYIQPDPTSLMNELYGFISCWYVGRHANDLLFNHASLPSRHVPHLLSSTQLESFLKLLSFTFTSPRLHHLISPSPNQTSHIVIAIPTNFPLLFEPKFDKAHE